MADLVPSGLALWKPFSGKGKTALQHDIVGLHTMVGTLPGSWNWANGAGRAYWHFGTSGTGEAWQCHDLRHRSAANLYGNPYVISIENADMGPGFGPWSGQCGDVPAFTEAQVEKNVQLLAYLCVRYNIPPKLIPDTRAGRRGIAYHRQGVPGSPEWSGGLKWSSSAGKCCPDWRRITQINKIIIPRVRALVSGVTIVTEDLDMEDAKFRTLVAEGVQQAIEISGGTPGIAVPQIKKRVAEGVQMAIVKGGESEASFEARVEEGVNAALGARVKALETGLAEVQTTLANVTTTGEAILAKLTEGEPSE